MHDLEVFDYIAERLAGFSDDWWLIGSSALLLHDVDGIKANDVDIVVPDAALAKEIGLALDAEPLEKSGSDRFQSSYFACKQVGGIDVEIMGGFRYRVGNHWIAMAPQSRVLFARSRGALYAPSLDELCEILRSFGRAKDKARLALIEAHLAP